MRPSGPSSICVGCFGWASEPERCRVVGGRRCTSRTQIRYDAGPTTVSRATKPRLARTFVAPSPLGREPAPASSRVTHKRVEAVQPRPPRWPSVS